MEALALFAATILVYSILVYSILADRLDRFRFELQEQIDLNKYNIKALGDVMQKNIKNTEKLCEITEKHIKSHRGKNEKR